MSLIFLPLLSILEVQLKKRFDSLYTRNIDKKKSDGENDSRKNLTRIRIIFFCKVLKSPFISMECYDLSLMNN